MKKKVVTYNWEPRRRVLLSSSGATKLVISASGLGGLFGSCGGSARKDARRPIEGVVVTVLNPGTAYTSYADALLGIGAGNPNPKIA